MTATAPSGRLSRIFLTTVVLPEPVPPAIPMISITWYINLKLLFDVRCSALLLTGDGDAWKKNRQLVGTSSNMRCIGWHAVPRNSSSRSSCSPYSCAKINKSLGFLSVIFGK